MREANEKVDIQKLEKKLREGIDEMLHMAHSGMYKGQHMQLANHTALLLSQVKTYFESVAGAIDMMIRHDMESIFAQMGVIFTETEESQDGNDDSASEPS